MFYIDSNIFLYLVIYDESSVAEAKRARDFLLKIALREIDAYTSTLTWGEVTWIIRRIFGVGFSIIEEKRLLSFPNLKFLGMRKTTILKAQEVMEKYKLRPRDAIHVSVVLENKISTLVSFDRDFDLISEIRRIKP
ncbi:type II toxin-antitoxin system VapC family toxin [Candidatus Bathyarchaeota archaeon]|nr:type II toxin-antitoxin system VapC family toxin [Candidatus Bathyarchaeota archaeon]